MQPTHNHTSSNHIRSLLTRLVRAEAERQEALKELRPIFPKNTPEELLVFGSLLETHAPHATPSPKRALGQKPFRKDGKRNAAVIIPKEKKVKDVKERLIAFLDRHPNIDKFTSSWMAKKLGLVHGTQLSGTLGRLTSAKILRKGANPDDRSRPYFYRVERPVKKSVAPPPKALNGAAAHAN